VPPLRVLLAILAGVLLALPTLRRREREAANVGETVARYMVERDRHATKSQVQALSIAAVVAAGR
jgi:hypothetical protein